MPSAVQPCCLVTGCAGNVGSNLTKALLEKGTAVVGVDNFSPARRGTWWILLTIPRSAFMSCP